MQPGRRDPAGRTGRTSPPPPRPPGCVGRAGMTRASARRRRHRILRAGGEGLGDLSVRTGTAAVKRRADGASERIAPAEDQRAHGSAAGASINSRSSTSASADGSSSPSSRVAVGGGWVRGSRDGRTGPAPRHLTRRCARGTSASWKTSVPLASTGARGWLTPSARLRRVAALHPEDRPV